jgi:hypothetical protein
MAAVSDSSEGIREQAGYRCGYQKSVQLAHGGQAALWLQDPAADAAATTLRCALM